MNIRRAWLTSPFATLVLAISVLLFLSTLGFSFFELREAGGGLDLFGALWWTVVTMTTVGYGDMVPQTTGGRLMGFVVMFCGIGLVSTLTGSLASLLVDRRARKRKGLLEVRLNDHVIIIGWNDFAPTLARTLKETGVLKDRHLVLVNTLPQETRDELSYTLELGEKLRFVRGQGSQKSVVSKARPETAGMVYIMSRPPGDKEGAEGKDADQDSIYAALTVRSLAPKVPIYAEVVLPENREHLLRAGVSEILVRGEVAGRILGLMGQSPTIWGFVQGMFGLRGDNRLGFRALDAGERRLDWGRFAVQFRARDGSLPLALCQAGKTLRLEDILDEGSALDNFILELFQTAGQETRIGDAGPRVLTNPPDDQPLEGFDAVLYLTSGKTVRTGP